MKEKVEVAVLVVYDVLDMNDLDLVRELLNNRFLFVGQL